ncbi:MAG: pyruvate formate lyase family protein [Enterocloster clostridioformis]
MVRNDKGIVTDYIVEGDFPKYGNNDDRVDELAADLVHTFMSYIKGNHTYRGGIPTTSILTITSNVVYGNNTGWRYTGRQYRQRPAICAVGANPMHHRDSHGAVASLASPLPSFRSGGRPGRYLQYLFHRTGRWAKMTRFSLGDLEVELNGCGGGCEAPAP